MKQKELYEPFKSNLPSKKYSVYVLKNNKKKLIHFGSRQNTQYFDKLGKYSSVDNNDKNKRRGFLARAKKIKRKDGTLAWNDPTSPLYYSVRYLW